MKASAKIFFIDQNEASCELYQQYLKMYGYTSIECFLSIELALLKLNKKPDIIIIDSGTNIIDNLGAIARLKNNNPDIYLLLLIKSNENEIIEQASKIGIFECVVKSDNDIMNLNLAVKRVLQTIELLKVQQNSPKNNVLKILNLLF